MQQVESVLGWSHTRHLLVKWAQSVSRKAQHGLWCSMFQQGMDPFEPSPALRLTWQLSSPWDFWPYLPTQKINFLTCLWSFTLRPLTLWIKGGTVDVRENFHFTGWDPWSSVALPETEPLLSLPEPQDCRHWLCGWIAPLSPLRLFTCMTYSPNFAGFKPKCKTNFLPWLCHSKFFIQTPYVSREESQVLKESKCYSHNDLIDQNRRRFQLSSRKDHSPQKFRLWDVSTQGTTILLTVLRPWILSFCHVQP